MGLCGFQKPHPTTQNEPTEIRHPPSPKPFSTPTVKTPIISREYNNNYLSRKRTFAYIKLHDPQSYFQGGVFQIPFNRIVKFGRDVQLAEAAALRFVAKNTTIPVPKVHCAFEHKHVKYIVMDRIDGEEIGKGWSERPEAERASLLRQLKGYFDQLRNIPHPRPGIIAAETGERSLVTAEERSDMRMVVKMQDQLQGTHKICFTHGDASSSNILVKKGKIVAIIDFELSGFYPEYWEYTCAMNVNSQDGFWKAEIGKFLDPYPRELEIEENRRKHFGIGGLRGRWHWK
ncbi:hypothetical protein LAWI1_G004856 [Lachnellula willkommii]|uniref:Aminoglycoside phosphotransferase domain-containing protein n=1 Tax=Lachnellula willkommii TaxID=215461 RepID=A0A559MGS1_9HELO|nr:hypothetical protein LAWI1_G004856 [Lachnellula willkommii]